MAAGHSSDPVSASPESRALRQHSASLVNGIADPLRLSWVLFAKEVIDEATRERASKGNLIALEKNDILVAAITRKVEADPSLFFRLVDTLINDGDSHLKSLGEKLEATYICLQSSPPARQLVLKAPSFFTKPQPVPAGANGYTAAVDLQLLPQDQKVPLVTLARWNTPPQPSLSLPTSFLPSSNPSSSRSSSLSSSSTGTLSHSALTGQGKMEPYSGQQFVQHPAVPETAAKLCPGPKFTISVSGASSQLNVSQFATQSQVSVSQAAKPPISSSAAMLLNHGNCRFILNEYCSKKRILPHYSTEDPTEDATTGFIGVVTVEGKSYKSSVAKGNRKAAETEAAAEAVRALGILSPNGANDSKPSHPFPPPPLPSSGATNTVATVSYKNLLQEHTQKLEVDHPDYDTDLEKTDDGFQSTVTVQQCSGPPLRFRSSFQPTKKAAEQEAAKMACIEIDLLTHACS